MLAREVTRKRAKVPCWVVSTIAVAVVYVAVESCIWGNGKSQLNLLVSPHKIGDVQAAQGAPSEALSSCQKGLEIQERLARQDPGNAEWQRYSLMWL